MNLKIYQVSSCAHIGFPVNDEALTGNSISLNIIKVKRQLVTFRPVLKSIVLSVETQMELFETFVEPVLLYGLFTIVYRKVDDDKLKAIQNTARGIKLDVYSRQQMSVKVLAEKVV
ncbi:hypothetical protein ACTXT7_003113 [Hymenolepis weldensis]